MVESQFPILERELSMVIIPCNTVVFAVKTAYVSGSYDART
jgi:hypothetical protein